MVRKGSSVRVRCWALEKRPANPGIPGRGGRQAEGLSPVFSLGLGGLDTPNLRGGPDEQRPQELRLGRFRMWCQLTRVTATLGFVHRDVGAMHEVIGGLGLECDRDADAR